MKEIGNKLNHLYAYADQNPIIKYDPTGEAFWLWVVPAFTTFGLLQCSSETVPDACATAFPNHKDLLHPDRNAYLKCVSGIIKPSTEAATTLIDPIGTMATDAGSAVGGSLSD